jgi:hypothetical protein
MLLALCLSLVIIFPSAAQADDPPVFLSGLQPQYTKRALLLGIGGQVEFRVKVDANGNIEEATPVKVRFEITIEEKHPSQSFLSALSEAGKELIASAESNLCGWKFTPGIVDGKPHESVITITLEFTPPPPQKDPGNRMSV